MLKEFREFALKGNLIDFAVGVIVGGAFGAIANSFVADIVSPFLGLLTGGINFKSLFVTLDGKKYESLEVAQKAGAPVVAYGNFIQLVITFLIVAFIMFLVVKAMNSMKKKEDAIPAPPPEPTTTEKLLAEIRDALKK